MATGVQGSVSTPTYVAVAVSGFAPPTAKIITVVARSGDTTLVAPNASYGNASNNSNPPPILISGGMIAALPGRMVLESGYIYVASNTSNSAVFFFSWEE